MEEEWAEYVRQSVELIVNEIRQRAACDDYIHFMRRTKHEKIYDGALRATRPIAPACDAHDEYVE